MNMKMHWIQSNGWDCIENMFYWILPFGFLARHFAAFLQQQQLVLRPEKHPYNNFVHGKGTLYSVNMKFVGMKQHFIFLLFCCAVYLGFALLGMRVAVILEATLHVLGA